MNINKCKYCGYFLPELKINNCSQKIVGTTHPEDSSCYKIKYINSNRL